MFPAPPQGLKWDGGRRTDSAATGVPTTTDTAYAYIKQIVNLLLSAEGDVQAEPDATRNVEVANVFEPGVIFYDPSGGIIGTADITPGTYTVNRIRGAAETEITGATASSEAAGRVYTSITAGSGDWNVGDLGYALFSGIVIWSGTSSETSMPDIPVFFRIVRTASIQTTAETINTNQGDPSGHTLTSTTAKIGDIARTLDLLIGSRWDSSGDLGTDIAALVDTRLTAQRALNLDWLDISTFSQETAGATNANGTSWVDLLDKSTITSPTKICGFKLTKAGTWAGDCRFRVTDGSGNKIFPFTDYYTEGTDFNSAVQHTLNFEVNVPVADGYKIQFCSTDGGDGEGETLALTNLDIIEVG